MIYFVGGQAVLYCSCIAILLIVDFSMRYEILGWVLVVGGAAQALYVQFVLSDSTSKIREAVLHGRVSIATLFFIGIIVGSSWLMFSAGYLFVVDFRIEASDRVLPKEALGSILVIMAIIITCVSTGMAILNRIARENKKRE